VCGPLNGMPEENWVAEFPNGPPAHVNCRCSTSLTMDDAETLRQEAIASQTAREREMREKVEGVPEGIKLPPVTGIEALWQNVRDMQGERAEDILREELSACPQAHLDAVRAIVVQEQGGGHWISGRAHINRSLEEYGTIELDPFLSHRWTVRHEVGHIAEEFMLTDEQWASVRDIYREDVLEPARYAGASTTSQIENWAMENYISSYASLDRAEMFAEGYAQWFTPDDLRRESMRQHVRTRSPLLAKLLQEITP